MKISLKWLNEYVDVSDFFSEPEKLGEILTRAGLEVEDMQNKAKDLKSVVVGHILEKAKHPNSDKLSYCQVQVSENKIEAIVCGAQNHKTGDKVVVALNGAVLPGNFAIKKSKIRDVESNGMLCSYKELGLEGDSQGIIILPAEAPVGEAYAKYADLEDVIFELKVTPNRADCLSHYGLAREVGCLLNRKLKVIEPKFKVSDENTFKLIKLSVEDQEICQRYVGRSITGVKIQDSPLWLKKRLESLGLNSINNVVDVTNYVMMELGQPLHAFDAKNLKAACIKVRKALPQEKFITLKDTELTLTGEELVIADESSAVALAGVIGGKNSGVSETTTEIFLESAIFRPMSVRKASRKQGVDTDSSYRFSRGVDPSQTKLALERAAELITQVAGGTVAQEVYDHYPHPTVKSAIEIKIETLSARLGYLAEEELFVQYMKGLHCEVQRKSEGVYLITPPLFRFDLEQDMDLVEEYARLKGYEHITEKLPEFHNEPTAHDPRFLWQNKLSHFLRAESFDQAFNYAFISENEEKKNIGSLECYKKLNFKIDLESIRLKNPLSEELNIMRRQLFTGLFKNMNENYHAGNEFGALFELGSTFYRNEVHEYKEEFRLALLNWGSAFGLYSDKTPVVIKLKHTLEKLLNQLQIGNFSFVTSEAHPPFLHKGQWTTIVAEGKNVGFFGTLHPKLTSENKIRTEAAYAEINLDLLLQGQPRPTKFKSVSSVQPVIRDFAFMMESHQALGVLMRDLKKAMGSELQEIQVFDIYEGDKLPQGQKSVAIRLTWIPKEMTYNEVQMNELMAKVVQTAEKSVGATLRS